MLGEGEVAGALFAAARVATLRAEVLDHLELAAPDGEQLGARGGGQGELLHSGCEKLLGGVGALEVIELRMAVRLKQHAPVRLWLRLRLRLPIGACVLWEAGLRHWSHRAGQVGPGDALRLRVAALDLQAGQDTHSTGGESRGGGGGLRECVACTS
jgi:hypothetical protein